MIWTSLIPVLGNLFDKLIPDQNAAAAAKLEVMRLAQSGELAQLDSDTKLALGQMEINKAEASNPSLFVSGWRSAVGWTCAAAFAFKFIGGPMVFVGAQWIGHPITLPTFDFTEMSTILLGMLGLSTARTVEKIKGVA